MKSLDIKILGKSIISIGTKLGSSELSKFRFFGGSLGGDIEDKNILSEGYMSNSDVFSIIHQIAIKASEVNFLIKDSNNNDVQSGILFDLVNSTDKHFNTKMEEAVINLLATGDLFIEKVESVGFSDPVSLEVLRSSSCEIISTDTNEIVGVRYSDSGIYRDIPAENIIHIKNYNPEEDNEGNHRGLSPLKPAKRVLSASNNREIASAVLLKNQGVSGIISDKSQALQDPEERDRVKKALKKNMGGPEKAGEYTLIGADVSVHQLGMSSKDLEISKSAPDHLRKMASIYHVSSRFFNDPQGSTYNNAATDAKNFYKNGVMPVVKKICRDISSNLRSIDNGNVIFPDFSSIEDLQEDQEKTLAKNKLKADGVKDVLLGNLDVNQKIYILVNIWKMEEQEAIELVGDGKNGQEENTGNQETE